MRLPCLFLSICFGSWFLFPWQNLYSQAEILYLHQLSTQEGLTSNTYTHVIRKDSHHFLWVSSINGLNRYDGKEVMQYLPDSTDNRQLFDPVVQSGFFEDNEGNIWFSTSQKIHYYSHDSKQFNRIAVRDRKGKEINDVHIVHFDPVRSSLWALIPADSSISRFDLVAINSRKPDSAYIYIDQIPNFDLDGIHIKFSRDLEVYHLYLPRKGGWEIREYKMNPRGDYSAKLIKKHPAHNAFAFHHRDNGNLWVGTDQGLVLTTKDRDEFECFTDFQADTIKAIRGIIPYDRDHLLIGTAQQGLFLFNLKSKAYTKTIYSIQNGLVMPFNSSIRRMYLDPDNTLWIATNSEGIFYCNLEKKRFPSFLQKSLDNSQKNVKSLSEGPEGNIWSITNTSLIITDQHGKIVRPAWTKFQNDKILDKKELYYIFQDSKSRMWVCSNLGLFVLRPSQKNFQAVPRSNAYNQHKIVATYIKELKSGRILVSSFGDGIFELKEESYRLEKADLDKGKSGDFTVIYEDQDANLYTSKYRSGIEIYTKNNENLHLKAFLPFGPLVYCMAESPDKKRIWLGSSQGLYWIEKQGNEFDLKKDDFFNQRFLTVNGMQFDSNNRMWISTNNGLLIYNPNILPNQTQEEPFNHFRIFDKSDGLQETEFNFYAYSKTKDQKLLFGGTNGYSLFDPREINEHSVLARPTITKIEINGDLVREGLFYESTQYEGREIKRLVLPPDKRSINLYFSAMEYGNPKACQFYYVLRDESKQILNQGDDPFVRYFDLDPGNYTLELYASNSEGKWSNEPLRMGLRLRPYFTETSLYYFILLVFALAGLYALYRNRIAHIRKQQKLAELETTILRVQMNPHFIFNSLNSIRSYIWDKNVKSADKLLMKVSALSRKVLELAKNQYISLREEKKLLEEYMAIEAIRFEGAFTYRFEIEEGLDWDETLVPTMILQAFVENAIIHGLALKKEKGEILIVFYQESDSLVCTISDNGVGRKMSAGKNKNHTSKALEITQKRLDLLTEKTGKASSLKIIDLYTQENEARGTQVELRIPIL
ncbi:MAG: two-component regulator propeller domain-containing protein [Bacteroidia bacterium]|nr:two-component regulator propeller domain-containing protein [Bacteroidia bacterium]